MSIKGPSLLVGQNTSSEQILAFMNKAENKNMRLVGKEVEGGTILYFRKAREDLNFGEKVTRFFEKISFTAQHQRQAVSNLMDRVISRTDETVTPKLQNREQASFLLSQLKNCAESFAESPVHKNQAVTFFGILSTLEHAGAVANEPKKETQRTFSKLEDKIPQSAFATVGDEVKLDAFNTVPKFTHGEKSYEPEKFIARGSFGNIFIYKNPLDENDKVIVKIPFPIANSDQKARFEQEAVDHYTLTSGENRHDNLLEMTGAFRMKDGRAGVIMEYGSSGTLHDIGVVMMDRSGDKSGQIPTGLRNVIAATLLKDMSSGLGALQERDIAHNDLKDVNVVIDKNGVAKLIDFGETQESEETKPTGLASDSGFYASPELLFRKERAGHETKALDKLASRFFDRIDDDIKSFAQTFEYEGKNFNSMDGLERELKSIIQNWTNNLKEDVNEANAEGFDAKKNDNWALGTAALKLFTGQVVANAERFVSSTPSDIVIDYAYGKTSTQTTFGYAETPLSSKKETEPLDFKDRTLARKTGDEEIDDLLSRQLSGDPSQRLSPQEFNEHPALQLRGVGSPQIRDLMQVLHGLSQADAKVAEYEKAYDLKLKEVNVEIKMGKEPSEELLLALQSRKNTLEEYQLKQQNLVEQLDNLKVAALNVISGDD